jgi:4-hydroxymandelate oxidase
MAFFGLTLEVPMTQIALKGSEISQRAMIARRQFLRFVAGSPLLTATSAGTIASLLAASSQQVLAQSYDVLRGSRRALGPDGIITAPADALDVFEFEPAAKKAMLSQGAPAHWGYLESGVDGDVTRDANHTAYERYNIRVSRLIDARKVDTSVKIFGESWASPIFMCPVSSLGVYNPEAGVAVARAAGKRKQQMMLSTVDNASIVDVNKAHGSPAWFMLYPTDDWNVTQALVQRAESAGSPAIVLTVGPAGWPQHRDPVPRAAPGSARMHGLSHARLRRRGQPQGQLLGPRHFQGHEPLRHRHDVGVRRPPARDRQRQARAEGHHDR